MNKETECNGKTIILCCILSWKISLIDKKYLVNMYLLSLCFVCVWIRRGISSKWKEIILERCDRCSMLMMLHWYMLGKLRYR